MGTEGPPDLIDPSLVNRNLAGEVDALKEQVGLLTDMVGFLYIQMLEHDYNGSLLALRGSVTVEAWALLEDFARAHLDSPYG